jgi:hypothetical protein
MGVRMPDVLAKMARECGPLVLGKVELRIPMMSPGHSGIMSLAVPT